MTTLTILEAFCGLAEAQQMAVSAGLLVEQGSDIAISIADMTALAAEIRVLQREAAAADVPHVPIGLDGNVVLMLDGTVVVEPIINGTPSKLNTSTYVSMPVRVTGKLMQHSKPAAPVEPRTVAKIDVHSDGSIDITADKVSVSGGVQFQSTPVADSDGWIKWGGGLMPVPKGTLVDVKHRDGKWFWCVTAGQDFAYNWTHDGVRGDIMAYRLHRTSTKGAA